MSEDTLDTTAFTVEDHPIPDELDQKWTQWGDKIRRYGARYFDPDEGKPRKIGQMRVIKGEHKPSNQEMWAHVLKTVARHAGSEEAQANPGENRYEVLFYVRVGDGEKQKRHAIRLQRDHDGGVYFDDDDAHDPDGRESFFREQVSTFERWAARQEAHALKVQDDSVKHIGKLMDKLTAIAEKIGDVTGAAAESNQAAAKMMLSGAKMFAASHQKNSEHMRYQLVQQQAQAESEERSQKVQAAIAIGAMAAPVILQQMGYTPEQVAGLMSSLGPMAAMIGGGGGGAMPGPPPMAQLKAAAPAAPVASDPAPDSDDETLDRGMADALTLWIDMRSEDEIAQVRTTIGEEHYQRIAEAAKRDDGAARAALTAFWNAVQADPQTALTKGLKLREVLGDAHAQLFVRLCQISAAGLPLE